MVEKNSRLLLCRSKNNSTVNMNNLYYDWKCKISYRNCFLKFIHALTKIQLLNCRVAVNTLSCRWIYVNILQEIL